MFRRAVDYPLKRLVSILDRTEKEMFVRFWRAKTDTLRFKCYRELSKVLFKVAIKIQRFRILHTINQDK